MPQSTLTYRKHQDFVGDLITGSRRLTTDNIHCLLGFNVNSLMTPSRSGKRSKGSWKSCKGYNGSGDSRCLLDLASHVASLLKRVVKE